MFRLLFTMVTFVLLGLGSGYFLWGSRVARLTESLSGLTLELDTMREKLTQPRATEGDAGGIKASDELRVINESVAAMRQELAAQKTLIESQAAAAVPADAAAANAELRSVRHELAACIADKQDVELRCPSAAGGAAPAPSYRPSAPAPAAPSAPPPAARPPAVNDLSDPRF